MPARYLILSAFFLIGCAPAASLFTEQIPLVEERIASIPLIIIGEGGTSGFLFQYAANTYVSEHGGAKYTVHDGDEFISSIKSFVQEYGLVTEFIYMGHGNEVGLYVNQAPSINGALYVNDPALDVDFRAASIYELPPETFAPGSTSTFYGCNIAQENLGQDSFAEQFANHFRTTVTAPTGPTEFSFQKNGRTYTKIPLDAINQPLYMVPTSTNKGFIITEPSATVAGYSDVYASMETAASIEYLTDLRLSFDDSTLFKPYQSVTYLDVQAFCRVLDPDASCEIEGYRADDVVRNTAVLKLLLDTAGFTLKKTSIPYAAQIAFGNANNLLPRDFIRKKWLNRAEVAMMTYDILQHRERSL